MAGLITNKEPLLTKDKVKIITGQFSCNDSKARNELGITYEDLETTIMDTLTWHRKEQEQKTPA